MDLIKVLFTGGIFIIGFLSFLLVGFNMLLNSKLDPVKENQARLETDIKEIKGKIDLLLKAAPKARHDDFNAKLDREFKKGMLSPEGRKI